MIKNIDHREKELYRIREQYLEYYYEVDTDINCDSANYLGLMIYSKKKNIKSELYAAFSKSVYDRRIVLHPQQMECLNVLESKENLLISAPTSFGKTYVALEYICRKDFNNIVFVVPTLALMNELFLKIKNRLGEKYNIVQNGFEKLGERNIIIIVPERADNELLSKLENIDLLVFDEIYKLKRDTKDDDKRLIVLNKGYFDLVNKSNQTILLGPFIKDISFDRTKLVDNITKFFSDYSPVYNKIDFVDFDKDEFVIKEIKKDSSKLVYFNTPNNIYKFCESALKNFDIKEDNSLIHWCEKYISENWLPAQMLKRGIGIHHGRLPGFMRRYIEDMYNNNGINTMLCTSTLLEGVNTPTNELIVYDSSELSAFRINNLIGRVGRLNTFQKGQVYLFEKSLEKYILCDEKYETIEIVAETDELVEIEEVIYLNKSESELGKEELKKFYALKKELLKYNKTIDDLKKTNGFLVSELLVLLSSINEIWKLLKEYDSVDNIQKTPIKSKIIEKFMQVIPYRRYYYLKDINTKQDNKIKTSICVSKLLNYKPKSVFDRIKKEINDHKDGFTEEQLNVFIDYLFDLAFSYIKYDLSRIVNYFEFLFEKQSFDDKEKNHLYDILNDDFLNRLRSYNSDNDKLLKILLDLDFPYSDAQEMKLIIQKDISDETISVSKTIEILELHFESIMNSKKIEDVSKDLLKVLLKK